MQETIIKLKEFGVPYKDYTEDNDNIPNEWFAKYQEIIEEIKKLITFEEAEIIIKRFP